MEQGPDFWCWFDTTQFSYHCVHPIHAKMFSIQMLLHFSQIVQRVCTLVLFILPAIISMHKHAYKCAMGVVKLGLIICSKFNVHACAYFHEKNLGEGGRGGWGRQQNVLKPLTLGKVSYFISI